MARYKEYDNGIYGHKYKKLYIVKDEREKRNSTFSVLQEDGTVIFGKLSDYKEAEWKIDIYTASEAELALLGELSKMEIYQINEDLARYVQLADDGSLTKDQKNTATWMAKVRDRKVEGLYIL